MNWYEPLALWVKISAGHFEIFSLDNYFDISCLISLMETISMGNIFFFLEKYEVKIKFDLSISFYQLIIASTARGMQSMPGTLYGREYDQGRVTYNYIYFQQKSLWPIFSSFFFPKLSPKDGRTGRTCLYHLSQNLGLISIAKWQETSVNKCHEHILLLIFIIYNCIPRSNLLLKTSYIQTNSK